MPRGRLLEIAVQRRASARPEDSELNSEKLAATFPGRAASGEQPSSPAAMERSGIAVRWSVLLAELNHLWTSYEHNMRKKARIVILLVLLLPHIFDIHALHYIHKKNKYVHGINKSRHIRDNQL